MNLFISLMLMNSIYSPKYNGEYYDFKDALANPKAVESLFLNYTFLEIKPINERIGEFENLKRLQLFPKIIELGNGHDNSMKLDESKSISPKQLPKEIGDCTELKYLDVSGTDIEILPKELFQIKNLETLHLSGSKVNMDDYIDEILQMKSLTSLFILECEIDEDSLSKLRENSKLRLYETESDLIEYTSDWKPADVQIHGAYFNFLDSDFAHRFAKSFPSTNLVMPRVIER